MYVRKNEFDKAPGSSLELGTLKAQIKFIDDIVAENDTVVKDQNDGVDWNGNREERQSFSVDEEDDRYREAIDRGDTEAAQRMVDEAAEEAFADSKVVNADGTPKVMYHGSSYYKNFTVFKSGKSGYLGPGMYFSDNEGVAKRYARQNGSKCSWRGSRLFQRYYRYAYTYSS